MKFLIQKNDNYTVMSNFHLREKGMSLKAKGLLSLMLSLPDEWDYAIEGLTVLTADGKDSIKAAIKELEKFGYLVRKQKKDENGRFAGYDYLVYEKPLTEKPLTEKPLTEKPLTEKPLTEKLLTEKPPQINIDILNKEIVSKYVSNKKEETYCAHARESYDDIMEEGGVEPALKEVLYTFIKHLQANGIVVINDRLWGIILALDRTFDTMEEKIAEIKKAISCGYKRLPCEG